MVEISFRYMAKQSVPQVSKDCISGARNAKPTWTKAFELLRYELKRIDAKSVVVEAGYRPEQVRADGWPYANATPEHSQLRLSFVREGVAVSFFQGIFGGNIACVAYNAWLIGMTLQALRAVERYGCTKSGQQYAGWSQLPPGAGRGPIVANAFATVEDAARFLLRTALIQEGEYRRVIDNPEFLASTYRTAARKTHPDLGGTAEAFGKVNAAKEMIESARGGAA
jgi:hypothetical protein